MNSEPINPPADSSDQRALSIAIEKLHSLLDKFATEDNLSNTVDQLLTSAYVQLLNNINADPERDVDPLNTFVLRESHLDNLYASLRLTHHIVSIKEQWNSVRVLKGKGVLHG